MEESRVQNKGFSLAKHLFLSRTSRLRVNTAGLEGFFTSRLPMPDNARGLSRITTRITAVRSLLQKEQKGNDCSCKHSSPAPSLDRRHSLNPRSRRHLTKTPKRQWQHGSFEELGI